MDLDAAIEQHNVLTTLINAKVAKLVDHINEVIDANRKVKWVYQQRQSGSSCNFQQVDPN